MYFESSYKAVSATSIHDCKQACLKNCSCMVVFFRFRTFVSVTNVFSLQTIGPSFMGDDSYAYLKVQLSPSKENKMKVQLNPSNENNMKVVLGATVGAATALVLLVTVVSLYLQRRRI
jgi:hypothetical protein